MANYHSYDQRDFQDNNSKEVLEKVDSHKGDIDTLSTYLSERKIMVIIIFVNINRG